MDNKLTIKCPFCGAEYPPSEIYYPDDLIGRPTDILKDNQGKIMGIVGKDVDPYATYECDYCHKKFLTEAVISFKTSPCKDIWDDDDDFAEVLKKD